MCAAGLGLKPRPELFVYRESTGSMARLNRTLKASILSGGAAFLLALPVAAQGEPPAANPKKDEKAAAADAKPGTEEATGKETN